MKAVLKRWILGRRAQFTKHKKAAKLRREALELINMEQGGGLERNRILRKKAEDGQAVFMMEYGLEGTDLDEWEKVKWLGKAVEQGVLKLSLEEDMEAYWKPRCLLLFQRIYEFAPKDRIAFFRNPENDLCYVQYLLLLKQNIDLLDWFGLGEKKERLRRSIEKKIKQKSDRNLQAYFIYKNIRKKEKEKGDKREASERFLKEFAEAGNDMCMKFYGFWSEYELETKVRLQYIWNVFGNLDAYLLGLDPEQNPFDVCAATLANPKINYYNSQEEAEAYARCIGALLEYKGKIIFKENEKILKKRREKLYHKDQWVIMGYEDLVERDAPWRELFGYLLQTANTGSAMAVFLFADFYRGDPHQKQSLYTRAFDMGVIECDVTDAARTGLKEAWFPRAVEYMLSYYKKCRTTELYFAEQEEADRYRKGLEFLSRNKSFLREMGETPEDGIRLARMADAAKDAFMAGENVITEEMEKHSWTREQAYKKIVRNLQKEAGDN